MAAAHVVPARHRMTTVAVALALALALVACPAEAVTFSRTYDNCAVLSVANNVHLAWSLSGSVVYMALWAPVPNGYVSAGFSQSGDMSGGTARFGEVWMVSTATSGTTCNPSCVLDGTIHGNDQPSKDSSSPASLANIVVSRNSTYLIGEFSRAITSAKATKDYTISLTAPMTVIWATHPSSKITSWGNVAHHRQQGSISVSFGASQPCNAPPTTGNFFESPGQDYRLWWTPSSDGTSITFTMEADVTGWVAVGFGAGGTMANSDIYVGWVTGSTVTLSDAWATGQSTPMPDTSQGGTSDVTNVAGSVVRRSYAAERFAPAAAAARVMC